MTAPDRIWIAGFLDECGEYYPSAVEAEGDHGGTAVEYARVTPDTITLPRAEVEALMEAAQGAASELISIRHLACGFWVQEAIATLKDRMK